MDKQACLSIRLCIDKRKKWRFCPWDFVFPERANQATYRHAKNVRHNGADRY